MTHAVEITRTVHAAPEEVWAVLTDLDATAQTLRGIERIERVAGEGYAVGTRWRETRRMFGKSATEEMYVTEVEAPRRTVVEADSAGVHFTSRFTLEPSADGTTLTMAFSGVSTRTRMLDKVMWTLFGPLGMRATTKAMRDDLEDIATAAEARAAQGTEKGTD